PIEVMEHRIADRLEFLLNERSVPRSARSSERLQILLGWGWKLIDESTNVVVAQCVGEELDPLTVVSCNGIHEMERDSRALATWPFELATRVLVCERKIIDDHCNACHEPRDRVIWRKHITNFELCLHLPSTYPRLISDNEQPFPTRHAEAVVSASEPRLRSGVSGALQHLNPIPGCAGKARQRRSGNSELGVGELLQ